MSTDQKFENDINDQSQLYPHWFNKGSVSTNLLTFVLLRYNLGSLYLPKKKEKLRESSTGHALLTGNIIKYNKKKKPKTYIYIYFFENDDSNKKIFKMFSRNAGSGHDSSRSPSRLSAARGGNTDRRLAVGT